MHSLDLKEFEAAAETAEAIILDTRSAGDFSKGFIPRSVNIGINGEFAPWVGALIHDVKQPLLLVTEPGKEEETVTRLSRVGFDNILGHLKGGFDAWKNAGKEIDTVNRISAQQFAQEVKPGKDMIVDVRKDGEYNAEHVKDAQHKTLDQINNWFAEIDNTKPFYLHCAGGYRSMIAASILKMRGIHNFKEIDGGFSAIAKTDLPKTNFVCQSKVS
jgi:rhodanese-related sulfurtransferase